MSEYFKILFADRIIALGTLVSICILVVVLSYTIFVYRLLPPYIPLYHQMPWGEMILGKKDQLFLPLLLSFSFVAINLVIAIFFYSKTPLLSRIVNSTSVVISFLVSMFIIQTTRLIL